MLTVSVSGKWDYWSIFSFYTFITYVFTSFLNCIDSYTWLPTQHLFKWLIGNSNVLCKKIHLISSPLNKIPPLSFPSQLNTKQEKTKIHLTSGKCLSQILPSFSFLFSHKHIQSYRNSVWSNRSRRGVILINMTKLPWFNLPPSLTWIIVVGSLVVPHFHLCPLPKSIVHRVARVTLLKWVRLQWFWSNVKNLRSDFTWLWINKLACYCFIDVDRRHKTLGFKTKVSLLIVWQTT